MGLIELLDCAVAIGQRANPITVITRLPDYQIPPAFTREVLVRHPVRAGPLSACPGPVRTGWCRRFPRAVRPPRGREPDRCGWPAPVWLRTSICPRAGSMLRRAGVQ